LVIIGTKPFRLKFSGSCLLFAYIGYHERLLEHHQCSNPDCRLVWGHRQLLGLFETALAQTAQLMEDCDEEPESGEEEDQAD